MNNTLGHSLLHQSPPFRFTSVQENQIKTHSGLFQASPAAIQATLQIKNHPHNCFNVEKKSKGKRRMNSMVPRAVLTSNPTSELAGKYNLDGNSELLVNVCAPSQGSTLQIDIQVTNSRNSLILHWGGIRDGQKNWILPSCSTDGTQIYKKNALRTPFVKSGSDSFLKIEIKDPEIQALEFLIVDESQNKWYKDNGNNFHLKLSRRAKPISNTSVPEDLVQVQAYLRWERKGKQMYTPEQEKVEYEAARTELLEEVASGKSIEELRARLRKGDVNNKTQEASVPKRKTNIPEDLVQVQAYLRWEKAGKPNFSPDQQQIEFEEARRDLQILLEKGSSIEEIRKKITKGEIKSQVPKQNARHFSTDRIQRKKRDPMQFLNKYAAETVEEKAFATTPKAPSEVELFLKAKEELDGSSVLRKKIFKLGGKKLLALVTNPRGKKKIYLATDFEGPLTLHWALSKKAGEWQAPPPSLLPEGSVVLDKASETQFRENYSSDPPYKVQFLEIEIGEEGFVGIPFVLRSGENWMKDSGGDFYVDFSAESKKVKQDAGDGKGTAKALLDKIAEMESEAQKSFMHRFNIAADLVEWAKDTGELGLAGILVWMRFMATRQLIWNKNYNVKPREISKAQERLTDLLQNIYKSHPQNREILRTIMSTVGRGGEGDVGQRIRDEILVIQSHNECKGGMMEEWHQKLHNNTSPDDVIICQALIDYIKNDFDMSVYWKTLNSNGITKERLLSYDRAIHNEPNFNRGQKDGLLRDLGHYMRTLKAVHSGADLESAVANCMGYKSEGQGFMVGVQINPISGLPSGFPDLLRFVLNHVEDRNVEPLLEGLLEARGDLQPSLLKSHDRLRDLLFLDIALDSTVRTAIERGYEELNDAGPEKIMYFITLVLENLVLSSDNNEDLIYCLKGWNHALNLSKSGESNWALYAKSVLDRTRLALTSKAEHYQQVLQPSAEYLGSLLGVDQGAVNIFTEEVIRAGSAASLSTLVNRLDPVLRKTANLGSWQVISPVEVVGYVVVVNELLAVQNKSYDKPTILVAKNVRGEEEIPDGTVAVLTPDMPDVLSHVSVRARNCKVCFATCFDPNILADLQSKEGKLLSLKPTSADVVYSEAKDSELSGASNSNDDGSSPSIALVRKKFSGKYAILSEEFTSEMVGAKSRNISYLKGKVPSWVGIPTSVALPFGVFEKVLSDNLNKEVANKLQTLKKRLGEGNIDRLSEIRQTVLELAAPPQLDDTMFEKQSALFALAIADIVLINMWCHDIGREHASNKPLLKTIFQVMMRLFSPRKTTLLFVIRDKTKTPLEHLEPILREDVQKIWDGVSKPQLHKDTLLSEFFNVEVTALSSYEEKETQFKQQVAQLRERFFHSITPGGLAGDRRGVVPASAFSFSAQQIWKVIRENKDLDLPTHKVMVATVRCEEIANEKFSRLASDEGWLALAEAVQTGPVSGFGKKLSSIIDTYLSEYDMDAIYFDEGVRNLKRQQLESKTLQFVYPAYQTVLGHLRTKVLDNFKHSLGQLFNKGEGFAASVRICSGSAMVEFDQGCADVAVRQANWDASKAREKLRRDIEFHTESVRIVKLSEITEKYEKQIIEALVEPLESLFETAGRDTWASIRKLLQRETEIALSGFSNDLDGFELHQGTFDNMVQNLRNFARSVVEKKAREEAGKVLIHMKDRFSTVFSHDNDSLPRVWTGKEDIRTITKEALSASLRILSVMAVIRLDERSDTIENVLFSSLLDGVTARAAQERSTGASTDPLASSSWEEVPPKDTLITPVQCKCLWRQFKTDTEYVIAQAVSAQEANKRRNSWLPPPWAILAMIVLGFNELMLLLRNPLYIMVFFIIFLLSKALWVQLDVEGEFHNGALAGLLSISSRFFPTILNILKRLFNDGQVHQPPPVVPFLGSRSFKSQTQVPTPITNSVHDSSSVASSVSSSSENVIECPSVSSSSENVIECSSSTLTRRRATTVEEAGQS